MARYRQLPIYRSRSISPNRRRDRTIGRDLRYPVDDYDDDYIFANERDSYYARYDNNDDDLINGDDARYVRTYRRNNFIRYQYEEDAPFLPFRRKKRVVYRGEHTNSSNNKNGNGNGTAATSSSTNDYIQHFVDTSARPQNYILSSHLSQRFQEFPKLKELVAVKDEMCAQHATPPMHVKCDLKSFSLSSLGTKFDVVLMDPPWYEYHCRNPSSSPASWSLADMMKLDIPKIMGSPAFIFLWVGSGEGLDEGRLLLKKWGFRRCEDICWLKTNKNAVKLTTSHTSNTPNSESANSFATQSQVPLYDKNAILQATKEHCLVGIKGTVRRSDDTHLIHCNIDTDVIVAEEPENGSTRKPEELYNIIEHFCLSKRRLELFGEDHNIRPGWVTLGSSISTTNYDKELYQKSIGDSFLLPFNEKVEQLRPKSPKKSK